MGLWENLTLLSPRYLSCSGTGFRFHALGVQVCALLLRKFLFFLLEGGSNPSFHPSLSCTCLLKTMGLTLCLKKFTLFYWLSFFVIHLLIYIAIRIFEMLALGLAFKSLGYHINLPVADFFLKTDRATASWLFQFPLWGFMAKAPSSATGSIYMVPSKYPKPAAWQRADCCVGFLT